MDIPSKQNELISELETLGIDIEGSIDDLRRRLSHFASQYPEMFPASRTDPTSSIVPPPSIPQIAIEAPTPLFLPDVTMEQIRKWDCHFEGRDPISFLERVDEFRAGYEITGAQLLKGIPGLLKGDALIWYRNHRCDWTQWEDFMDDLRDYFVLPQYRTRLIHKIQGRLQRPERYAISRPSY